MKTLLLASALLAGLVAPSAAAPQLPTPAPDHAFCRSQWLFATSCRTISKTLINQIRVFNPLVGCAECQYELVSVGPQTVNANHTSTDGLLCESLIFTFTPVMSGGCTVAAFSISLGFTPHLDNGLNYCNLYNLLSASGLIAAPGFMEMTNEWACPGYELTTCRV